MNTAGIHEGLFIQSEEGGSSFCNDKTKQRLYMFQNKNHCVFAFF